MKVLEQLYSTVDKEGIDIEPFQFSKENRAHRAQGIYIKFEQCCPVIGLNYSYISTHTEEKCVLAEELGHYYTGTETLFLKDRQSIDRQEYRAIKWAVKRLIPWDKLRSLLKQGITAIWDLAERLDVTEDLIKKALDIYSRNYPEEFQAACQ